MGSNSSWLCSEIDVVLKKDKFTNYHVGGDIIDWVRSIQNQEINYSLPKQTTTIDVGLLEMWVLLDTTTNGAWNNIFWSGEQLGAGDNCQWGVALLAEWAEHDALFQFVQINGTSAFDYRDNTLYQVSLK